jgi:hypothetical protein
MLGLEAANYDRCAKAAERAETASDRINWTSGMVEGAFNCVEICGQLRNSGQIHSDSVEGIAQSWREVATQAVVRRYQLVQSARAELAS